MDICSWFSFYLLFFFWPNRVLSPKRLFLLVPSVFIIPAVFLPLDCPQVSPICLSSCLPPYLCDSWLMTLFQMPCQRFLSVCVCACVCVLARFEKDLASSSDKRMCPVSTALYLQPPFPSYKSQSIPTLCHTAACVRCSSPPYCFVFDP